MTLTLRAVSLNDHPLTQPITVHFDAQGGSIGRADHNTMALPDPKRHISRQQAEVKAAGDAYAITNVGSANPILVGSRTLARGESAPLLQGDRLRIGGYLLEVEFGAGAEAATIVRGRAAVDVATPPTLRAPEPAATELAPPGSFGAEGAVPLSPGNPFASLFGADTPAARDEAGPAPGGARADAWTDAREGAHRPAPDAGSAVPSWSRLPDDFDPFAPPPASAPAVPRADAPAGAFGDLIPAPDHGSIDRFFGLVPNDSRDPLAGFLDAAVPTPAGRGASTVPVPLSTDPLALFGAAGAAPPDGRPTGSDHVPELQAAFAPPRLVRGAPASTDPRPAPPAALRPSSSAWAAFCEGAGVHVERPEGGDAEALRDAGALLRAAIDGTLRLMAVRASAKHELHAPVTVIQPQRNNPLKFSPDANAALEQLLQPAMRGFLPGPSAVQDAMDDLVGHAIGTLAGTRAALEGVLDRFVPGQLESKLAARSVLDSVLPMNRKARLWELYLQHFETIRSEAQDDFHSLFGRAFLAAYEQQLERLRGA